MNFSKLIYLYFSIFSFFCVAQSSKEDKVNIFYLSKRYESDYHMNYLTSILKNNTTDTLIISADNIIVRVIKNGKLINEDKIPTHRIVMPRITNQYKCKESEQHELKIENLKLKFATKLYEKNFGSNPLYVNSREYIIKKIVQTCIVLIPNEVIDYKSLFYSKKFDKTCKVSVKYLDSKRFTYFVDDNGKKIDINN